MYAWSEFNHFGAGGAYMHCQKIHVELVFDNINN